jgi:hypothetical protein
VRPESLVFVGGIMQVALPAVCDQPTQETSKEGKRRTWFSILQVFFKYFQLNQSFRELTIKEQVTSCAKYKTQSGYQRKIGISDL